MAKKLFTFIAGTLLLAPVIMALCSDNLLFITFAVVYGIALWHSPKLSTRMKRFWRKFWKVNMEFLTFYGVR